MKIILAPLLALGLAGCIDISPEHLSQLDRRDCDGYGFQRGTDPYAECLMTEHNARQARILSIMEQP